MTQLKLITTEDGSHSLYREDMRESYHSFHGAWGESMHVFIENGLYTAKKHATKELIVFEVGFGTGLNALLAAIFAKEHQIAIHFHTVEPIPVPKEIYTQLNFGRNQQEKELLQKIHEVDWEVEKRVTKYFTLSKYATRLEDFEPKALRDHVDVIFFDAFAPSKQSEIWNVGNLEKCFSLLKSGGMLTTYCAQGQFKRDLASSGFEVETLNGALGKKEMVRGIKS